MGELVKVMDEIESTPPINWDGRTCSDEEAPEKRIEALQDSLEFCFNPPDPTINTARDFLSEDKRDVLIRVCRLDGVTHGEVDIAFRNAWIDDVEKRMSTAERAQVRPDCLPADLKYLMTLVRGICGPGLPQWRMFNQLRFLSDLDEDEHVNYTRGGGTEAGWIAVPNTQEEEERGELGDLPNEWEDCEVAMAVGVGEYSFAVYCRRHNGDGDGEWGWKFGQQEPPCNSGLYDTIEEFLEWYAEWPRQD